MAKHPIATRALCYTQDIADFTKSFGLSLDLDVFPIRIVAPSSAVCDARIMEQAEYAGIPWDESLRRAFQGTAERYKANTDNEAAQSEDSQEQAQ